MMNLTWQLTLLIIIGIIALVWVITLEYKKPEKPDQKKFGNPFVNAIIITLLFIVIVMVMEGFDIIPEGSIKKHWYIFLLLFIGVLVLNYKTLAKLKPLPMEKLEHAFWCFVARRWKAGPHRGPGFGSPLFFHTVKRTDEDDEFNKVVWFLGRINRAGGRIVLVGLDIGNAYPVKSIESPAIQLVNRLIGSEAAQQYDIERRMLYRQEFTPEENPDEYENQNTQAQATPA